MFLFSLQSSEPRAPVETDTDSQQKESTVESENEDWTNKYGADAAKAIRSTVDENIPHYEYLRQFRIKA